MKYFLSILLTFLFALKIDAQVKLSGVVVDSNSLEPLPLVSVMLVESYMGTQTDENGKFSIQFDDGEKSIILFTMIGYEDLRVPIKDFNKSGMIYLKRQEHELGEVVVRPVDAYELLQEVVKRVPENYYSEPIGQEVFFRQSMYTNNQLNILEEAHVDILNSFRKDKLPKNVSVHKARGFVDLDEYADLGRIIANNIDDDSINMEETAEILLAFNPKQRAMIEADQSIFAKDAAKFYDIVHQGWTEKNGHICHIVAFDQKEGLKKTLFKGVLYIDTASLAITEFKAGLSPEGLDFQKFLPLKIRMLIKLAGFKIQIKELAVQGRYRLYNGYWVVQKGGFQLEGSIARGKGAVLNGALNLEFFVDHNYPRSSFYNLSSPYAVIPSDLEPFKALDFWEGQDVFRPKWSKYIQQLLDDKLMEK